jgi:hypothetical protein
VYIVHFFFLKIMNSWTVFILPSFDFIMNRDNRESVELTRSDIKCLDPGVYLSSPVINFYIQ